MTNREPTNGERERIWELMGEGATNENIVERMVASKYNRKWARLAVESVIQDSYHDNVGGDNAAYENYSLLISRRF